LFITNGISRAANAPNEGEKLFALKVKPLFAEKCLACHGNDPDNIKGGFDMRTRPAMLRGGDTFLNDALIPGKGEESYLYILSTRTEEDYEMPPKEADQLTQEQTWWIRDWINAGAPWPDENRVAGIQSEFGEGVQVVTSGGLSDDWDNRRYLKEDLWAYQPLNPGEHDHIDAFIEAKLNEAQLPPAPAADARTLIRRATFDLTGLPPTPEEVEAFESAYATDAEAWPKLIDRLLSSPHYGEQWARHWLDVVRYADSSGYANDWERPNAWRYRDYVIRSFNSDKPYDQFIREQIAGDEIGKRDDVEMLIATGFLRMGAWEHTGMSVAKVTRQLFLDDVTDSVSQVFLGHALRCAKCHDHKFDPVPTRDYYAFQANFATTQFVEQPTEWLPDENISGLEEDRRYHLMRREANQERLDALDDLQKRYQAKWFAERNLPYPSVVEARKAGETNLPKGRLFEKPEEFGAERIERKWKARFDWEMDRYKPVVFTVYNGKTRSAKNQSGPLRMPENPMDQGELEQTSILDNGDIFAPTEPVAPGVISALQSGPEASIPQAVEGRRSALADWIASPDNPLTSRAIVNRIWQYHFGKAIAQNPNNFGATGKKPTHPELLDRLAKQFVEQGWSIKKLHRTIMMSKAYQRASTHPDLQQLNAKDSARNLYAVFQPKRLAAEELRDAMLAVSGELNPEMGGIPVRPDINLEAALQPRMIMGTFAPSYVPNPKPEQRNRRTIYAHKTRGHRDPFLETFNQPNTELSCEMRDNSNITPQAFTLFNGEETRDRSLAFASRVLNETNDDEQAIQRAFRLAFGRDPSSRELRVSLDHWKLMTKQQTALNFEPQVFPTEVIREAQEENTGENFEFTETLFVFKDYIPDLQPHQLNAKTRALADICLALLNANEFIYID
jgi:mono/diheme cytochrome c family protein